MCHQIIFTLSVLILYLANPVFAERIVLKDNRVIQGKIERRSGDTVWVNLGPGSVGYNINDISYIYKDDDNISEYSPKSKEEVIKELQGELIDELSKVRGLPLKTKIESDELTPEEIKEFYFKEISENLPKEHIESEEKILKKLKLVPSDFSYYETFKQFARQDVGGFYDYKDKKLYISKAMPEELRPFILTHETVHALQDQNFNLKDILPKEFNNSDLMTARTSLAEGDATITSYDFQFKSVGQDIKNMPDMSGLFREAVEINFKNNPGFAKYSPFLQEQILFPYLQGSSFVHKILQNYSYDKLNEIYKDPPSSTEQILHIEKYIFKKDTPVYITLKTMDELLPGWKKIYSNRWGEYSIYSYLKQYHGMLLAKAASEGWGGDQITGYENAESKKILLNWVTAWDTEKDAEEFYEAYSQTVDKRYAGAEKLDKLTSPDGTFFDCGEEGLVYIGIKGKQVLIIEGIDSESPAESISAFWSNIEQPQDVSENGPV